ncbi:ERF family protein [uncultured Pelagimonas sp.]|uniref:ERF family protein n=1 Tax=uncultured Pelagimonas sp. TaxID=1618102 RepID=UPI002616B2B0|nr:ERF family protein [uncultured Pelagimonas sp.]
MSMTETVTTNAPEIMSQGGLPAAHAADAGLPAPVKQSDMIWSQIARLSDPSVPVDMDRFERFMTLHKEVQAKEAETAFDAAKSAARAEVGVILKNQDNAHTKSKYADIDQILAQLVPAISKHGLNVSFQPWDAGEGWQGLSIYVSGHGHKEVSQLKMPLDGTGAKGNSNKNGAQAVMSTLTYLQRALVRMAFNLSTGSDDDGNYGQEAQVMPDNMVNYITEMLIDTGTRLQAFLGSYQVETIPQLSPQQADEAIAFLEKKVAQKGGEA